LCSWLTLSGLTKSRSKKTDRDQTLESTRTRNPAPSAARDTTFKGTGTTNIDTAGDAVTSDNYETEKLRKQTPVSQLSVRTMRPIVAEKVSRTNRREQISERDDDSDARRASEQRVLSRELWAASERTARFKLVIQRDKRAIRELPFPLLAHACVALAAR